MIVIATGFAFAPSGHAQTVAAPNALDDETIVLSPFNVDASQDTGYRANSTLAGTRLKADLNEIGASVSVYTEDFLDDIGVHKIEDILNYTTSTEGGGINGNYSGIIGEDPSATRENPSAVLRVRGLAPATRTRDYFPTDMPVDRFNVNAITISRGPNAVLAGIGAPGGIIDSALRQATFRNSMEVKFDISSFGGHRQEFHGNRVLVPKRVAFRLDVLNEHEAYRQEQAYANDKRYYMATKIVLREQKPGAFFGATSVRANYENGKIKGTPPNQLPPILSLDSWFTNANPAAVKWYVDGATYQTYHSDGTPLNSASVPIVPGYPIYRNLTLVFNDPSARTPSVGFTDLALSNIQGFQGTIPGGAEGPGGSLSATGDITRNVAGYSRTRLMDSNVFDFYNQLITGDRDSRKQNFDGTNLRLEQLLWNGKSGFEVSYDKQNFSSWRDFSVATHREESIYIDVNKFLTVRSDTYPNGIPNPNFGRPFITSNDSFRDRLSTSKRESYQATAFVRHDFGKRRSGWTKWLGRHELAGLWFKTTISSQDRGSASSWNFNGQLNIASSLGDIPGGSSATVYSWYYLGPSAVNAANVSDLRLHSIGSAGPEVGRNYTLRIFDPSTQQFVTGTSDVVRLLKTLRGAKQTVDSQALTLHSRWLKNHLTTLVGWRKDKAEAFTAEDVPLLPDGSADASQYRLLPASTESKDSWSKSVVLMLPERVIGRLPLHPEMRLFWNDSSNFSPVGQRRNQWNEELGSPSARTREHGVMLTVLDGKIDLRITRFKTSIKEAAIGGINNAYGYTNTIISRMARAQSAGLNPSTYRYVYPTWATFEDVARAYYETIPERLKQNIGPDKNFNPRFEGTGPTFTWVSDNITNLVSVTDTISTGTEFELTVNLTKNWRVAVNVAKNEAVKADAAREELAYATEWIHNLNTMFDGALGRGFRNPPTERQTLFGQYNANTVNNLYLAYAESGTATPEIREWRANVVSRYQFRSGVLKGFSISGSARWQDKIIIGYPQILGEDESAVADLSHPFVGPTELALDMGLRYQRQITLAGSRVNWSVGLNVRNLNANDELIPITANADGTYGTVRIPPNRSWTLSTSFQF